MVEPKQPDGTRFLSQKLDDLYKPLGLISIDHRRETGNVPAARRLL